MLYASRSQQDFSAHKRLSPHVRPIELLSPIRHATTNLHIPQTTLVADGTAYGFGKSQSGEAKLVPRLLKNTSDLIGQSVSHQVTCTDTLCSRHQTPGGRDTYINMSCAVIIDLHPTANNCKDSQSLHQS
jgi:hypothetical protein